MKHTDLGSIELIRRKLFAFRIIIAVQIALIMAIAYNTFSSPFSPKKVFFQLVLLAFSWQLGWIMNSVKFVNRVINGEIPIGDNYKIYEVIKTGLEAPKALSAIILIFFTAVSANIILQSVLTIIAMSLFWSIGWGLEYYIKDESRDCKLV